MSTPNLSLFQIETELLELLRFREDVVSDADMTSAEQADSLEGIDRQIDDYIRREVQKADGIAAYLRECEARAEALKDEAKRIKERADAWTARMDRIKAGVLRVMRLIGKTKIEGHKSTLAIRKNPPSVEIRQPDLVPDEYLRVTVTMPAETWKKILNHFPYLIGPVGEPSKTAIREALKRGEGVPGCQMNDENTRLEVK